MNSAGVNIATAYLPHVAKTKVACSCTAILTSVFFFILDCNFLFFAASHMCNAGKRMRPAYDSF